ncbi:MAG: LPS export ABC transporter periplasmic protein LptC, partial [Comamonas sp.]|nr:LPS export ABC transporter periplasmic protein LptC [Comamonas sp.]
MKTTLSDRLSLYLPIVLMGLLALGSWWLVRSAPRPLAAQAVALPENQQDYTVEDFSTQQFAADGHLTSQIWGQQARHYLQADILEIDQVRTRSQGAQGVLTTTSAQRGISNSDASEVQLWG